MKYPIAFCDYDATIFDAAAGEVPSRTLSAIFRYMEAGGTFVITTGRMYRSILLQLAKVGLDPHELICLQGSVGYQGGKEVFCHDLSAAEWRAVARFAEQRGWVFQAYHDMDVYTAYPNEFSEEYFAYTEVRGVYVGEPVSEWHATQGWTMHKIIVMSEATDTPNKLAALRAAFPQLDITCSNPRYIEIVTQASGKGNGLRAMCRHLGFDSASSVAFGDELNDVSLIQAAGVGVAVANAVPALLSVADYVCASCADSGVADVLDAIRLGQDLPR